MCALGAILVGSPVSSQVFPTCAGDCNLNGIVTIDELVRAVNVALGSASIDECEDIDVNRDGEVTIDELVRAVSAALTGCPATPTVTETPPPSTATATPTGTPTDGATSTPTDTELPATFTPTATPTPTSTTSEAPCFVSDLIADVEGTSVDLSWASTGCLRVRLLRRLNAAPEGPADPAAVVIYDGGAAAATDSLDELFPTSAATPRTYFYRVFACDGQGVCPAGGAGSGAAISVETSSTTSLTVTLPQLLRAGGYNIHFRHAEANTCSDRLDLGTAANTSVPNWWRSCDAVCTTATARQLDDFGREQSMVIGEAIRDLEIPIGRVLSSEYCRNFGTAEIMNFGPPIELVQELTYFVYDEENRCEHTLDFVSRPTAAGTNVALIGHGGFPEPCPIPGAAGGNDFGSLARGEAAIMRPLGVAGSELIVRLRYNEWDGLAHARPLGLNASIENGVVRLNWTLPDPASGNTRVRLVRRLNGVPAGPNDPQATLVYEGSATRTGDPVSALLPNTASEPRSYFYTVYGCDELGACETSGSGTQITPTLVEALQGGGYVLHFRHASATVCADNLGLGTAANTSMPNWWKSCDANCTTTATARQLNDMGRMESIVLGQFFRSRGVPFGRVLSSEYCRNFQTAELMDLGPPLELLTGITYFVYDEVNRCQNSYELIRQVPAAGTNTVIIGHAGFPGNCEILGSLAWSEAAIFKPDGVGGQQLIARRMWNQWEAEP